MGKMQSLAEVIRSYYLKEETVDRFSDGVSFIDPMSTEARLGSMHFQILEEIYSYLDLGTLISILDSHPETILRHDCMETFWRNQKEHYSTNVKSFAELRQTMDNIPLQEEIMGTSAAYMKTFYKIHQYLKQKWFEGSQFNIEIERFWKIIVHLENLTTLILLPVDITWQLV